MPESNFDFLDDLIQEPSKEEETVSPLSEAEIQKLKEEVAEEGIEELGEAKKSFGKLDMEEMLWSQIQRTKQYLCITVNKQMMGQDGKPFLYHKNLEKQVLEIAAENNGRIHRADKMIPAFLKLEEAADCQIILVHKAKSAMQIKKQEQMDRFKESEKTKIPVKMIVEYNNKSYKDYPLVGEASVKLIENEVLSYYKPKVSEPISAREDNKYIVFPTKYLFGSGNLEVLNAIGKIERHINAERSKEGKKPISASKYIVCNQDEPYAEDVWGVILRGEDNKLK